MNITLDRWHAQYILEALQTLDEKWTGIMQNTDDEDVQSDYGNDIGQLKILQERFEHLAIEAFGKPVTDFSREPYVTSKSEPGVAA